MGKPAGGGGFQASSFKFKTNDLMLETNHKGLFVDASRNAAVSAGDRDLKSDVRDKKLREKYEDNLSEYLINQITFNSIKRYRLPVALGLQGTKDLILLTEFL